MEQKNQLPNRWINTPVIYTEFTNRLTLLQQDVLMMVSSKLQEHYAKYLNEKRYQSSETPKCGIAPVDLLKLKPVEIPISDLGLHTNNFTEVYARIKELQSIEYRLTRYDSDGKPTGIVLMPIFSSVYVPTDGKKGFAPDLQRNIKLTINIEVAKGVFDMQKGYIHHLSRFSYYCKSVYTSRLYFLLMKHVSHGQFSPVIDYVELQDRLGLLERDRESGVIIQTKNPKFSQFKQRVLCVAREDMRRMIKEKRTEIALDCSEEHPEGFEVIRKNGKKQGIPVAIRFFIKKTNLETLEFDSQRKKQGYKLLEPTVVPSPIDEGEKGKYKEEWLQIVSKYEGSLKPFLVTSKFYGVSPAGFLSIRFADTKTLNKFEELCESNKSDYQRLLTLIEKEISRDVARVLVRGVE